MVFNKNSIPLKLGSFNNSYFKYFIHSTAILMATPQKPLETQPQISNLIDSSGPALSPNPELEASIARGERAELDAIERLENERLSQLQLIKYKETPVEEGDTDYMPPCSTYAEAFPWYVDEEGRNIDYNKPVNLFDGVKLISHYLETRYQMDPNLISNVQLSELLELFTNENNENVTVADLYDHVSQKFQEDESNFTKKLKNETENFSDNLLTDEDESNTSKPFGQHGEITLNQLGVALKEKIKDLNWEFIYNNTKLTINGLPLAANAIGYGLILKTYIKHVHHRPIEAGFSKTQRESIKLMRNRQLGIFCILGAPLTMFLLRFSAIPIKELYSLSIGGDSPVANNNSNSNSNTINSILFLSYLNKKIPRWLKILFKILFVTILVLKLLGFSFLSVFSINVFYIKVGYYILFSLIICYYLLSLYLLHKFSKKNMKILDVLPEFLIK